MKLIKNGRVIDPKSQFDARADILIDGQKIIAIGQDLTQADAEIIDATGKIVAPGLIDGHVHFREPGQTHKEDIHTGSLSAARGGFTTVVMMANTNPTVSTVETLTEVLSSAAREKIHVKSVATITDQFDGQTLTDFESLLKAGAAGFSDDGIPFTDAGRVRRAMQKAASFDTILVLHEEDPQLTGVLGINDGAIAHQCGVIGAPTVSEYSMVARDAMLALDTKARVHFQHLSAGESVDVIRFAKSLGAQVTAEVTPQHFSITEDAILTHGTSAKLNPPLRRSSDIEKLIVGLQDGTIDVIATDHAPHTHAEKDQEFTKAPSGMIGLETSLSLGLTHLVAPGHLSLMSLLEKMTSNPAQVMRLDAGYLAENGAADLVIFDADAVRKVTTDFASKSSNSPFVGNQLQGVIAYTICDGEIVYQA
ncbi:MAG: dihydroorotase [Lactococcus raffinolactis]|mgnify:FL=1|jgi:dihydroorotase|uniref:Dihydroorotase n=1 Tax=Pseudolactococcus raffinolactis TaxID=1366 RepID=A0AAE6YPY5_9LACT|nr:dihydroorotase [Lactococcus raffinolactis]QIW52238.1 dihydroorotase [Lactococcus raffinolactis]QIW59491.1 dihydroorotase [Lactococcus raffinolactis]